MERTHEQTFDIVDLYARLESTPAEEIVLAFEGRVVLAVSPFGIARPKEKYWDELQVSVRSSGVFEIRGSRGEINSSHYHISRMRSDDSFEFDFTNDGRWYIRDRVDPDLPTIRPICLLNSSLTHGHDAEVRIYAPLEHIVN